jgi:hypothetical protein
VFGKVGLSRTRISEQSAGDLDVLWDDYLPRLWIVPRLEINVDTGDGTFVEIVAFG